MTPSARREMATRAVADYAISIRRACQVFKVSEGCYRYQPVLADENQEIADWERKLDLLKEFTRKKNELLQADVNKYLNFATAKLFRPLLNGDTEECCDFVYNGEAYARNLNHGARMLTEADICRAFQKVASVNFPIIIDDTESVDDWRIPQIDNQLIMLKHTQDKELVVEAV